MKAENLHGVDLKDRQLIFKTLLPEENFVDRRIDNIDLIEAESDDPISEDSDSRRPNIHELNMTGQVSESTSVARQYVGELI